MSGLPLIGVSIILAVVVLRASLGGGAQHRTVGLHVPGIHRDASVWIAAHRAARWIALPCCALGAVLGAVALFGVGAVVPTGWAVWPLGLLGGAVAALVTSARHRLKRS